MYTMIVRIGASSCYVAQMFFQTFMRPNGFLKVLETFVAFSPGLIGMTLRRLTKKVKEILAPMYSIVGLDDNENLISKDAVFADGGKGSTLVIIEISNNIRGM